MKTFLLKGKKPCIKWGSLKDETYFEGEIPDGYSLAVSPTEGYIIVDVDVTPDKNGFANIPFSIRGELECTFNYKTTRGRHYWLKYTGKEELANKTSNQSIDLRTHKGYVKYPLKDDIRDNLDKIKETSIQLNNWLESLFSYNF